MSDNSPQDNLPHETTQGGDAPTIVMLHEGLGCVALWRGGAVAWLLGCLVALAFVRQVAVHAQAKRCKTAWAARTV